MADKSPRKQNSGKKLSVKERRAKKKAKKAKREANNQSNPGAPSGN